MATSFPTPPLRPGTTRDTRMPESSHLPSSERGPDRGDTLCPVSCCGLVSHMGRLRQETGVTASNPGPPGSRVCPPRQLPPPRGATLSPAPTSAETLRHTLKSAASPDRLAPLGAI
ncbi:unnamed protein product [Rangifer tarandus platyrhynchus]|uniref:Uncharacterized protein n=2 Tax=Rangifer tarandus platyrhynchus TaxID=3082113 RepID=A0ABN8ZMG5_RANTA|nr:unnamed protein product [Rangifer tarandus platyrhynchus]